MHEFLQALCAEIRYKPARPAIEEEYRTHIEELAEQLIAEKDKTPEAALATAVARMGNPIEIGRALNRTHRPRMDWPLLAFTVLLTAAGIFVQVFMSLSYTRNGYQLVSIGRLIPAILIGLAVMVGCLFVDLQWVKKYAPYIFFAALAATPICRVLYAAFGGSSYFYLRLLMRLPLLLSPILIATFPGLLATDFSRKPILIGFVTLATVFMLQLLMNAPQAFALLAVFFIMTLRHTPTLPHSRSKRTTAAISGATLFIVPYAWYCINSTGNGRIAAFFRPDSYASTWGYSLYWRRQFLSAAKPFGTAVVSIDGQAYQFSDLIPGAYNIHVMAAITANMGWVFAAGACLLLGLFLWRMAASALKIRDDYHRLFAVGLAVYFIFQIMAAISVGFGLLPEVSVSLPFLSYDNINYIVNMSMVGLLLGVYRRNHIACIIVN